MDPGNSYTLDYDLTGNGKIDPITVKWEVTANTENGSFPTADPTYGKLTISDTASGTISVRSLKVLCHILITQLQM